MHQALFPLLYLLYKLESHRNRSPTLLLMPPKIHFNGSLFLQCCAEFLSLLVLDVLCEVLKFCNSSSSNLNHFNTY
jgi:hypothetical protein